MPKAGNSKKRKRERKKDENQGAKKAKSNENDGQHKNPEDTSNVTNEPSNLPYEEQQEIDDLDEKLEQNAAKNNLTTINVKSILHVSIRCKIRVCYLLHKDESVYRRRVDTSPFNNKWRSVCV